MREGGHWGEEQKKTSKKAILRTLKICILHEKGVKGLKDRPPQPLEICLPQGE